MMAKGWYRRLGSLVAWAHWGRVTHICVSKELTIIGSDNGLSPGWRQAIICTNAGLFLVRTLGTNFSEIFSEIHPFSFKKIHLKMSPAKWWTFVSASMCQVRVSHLRQFTHAVKAGISIYRNPWLNMFITLWLKCVFIKRPLTSAVYQNAAPINTYCTDLMTIELVLLKMYKWRRSFSLIQSPQRDDIMACKQMF